MSGTDDQYGSYFDEDCLDLLHRESTTERGAREIKVKAAVRRRSDVLDACRILAFDGTDAARYQVKLKDCLQSHLMRCDVCVREYHRSRGILRISLEAQYDEDEVLLFMNKFDAMNKERIIAGLESMTEALFDLPPEDRNITAAGEKGTYALFEAFNSVPFLMDEEALVKHFDQPFRLVQTKKKVKLTNYAPGMTAFLFSHDKDRASWAYRMFANVKRPLSSTESEYSVKPFLDRATCRVNIASLDIGFLPTFWKASLLILSKLTKELLSDLLRNSDANLCTLAMEHFQVEADHFADMIASYYLILDLCPNDFWAAMGGITAQHVVENIFKSPVLQRLLKVTDEAVPIHLELKLGWIPLFIRSIKPANLVPPVRVLLDQLLHDIQGSEYSNYARNTAWAYGLRCLLDTLRMMKSVGGGPVVTHMIEVVAKDHISVIMQELDGIERKKTAGRIEDDAQSCLDIVEAVLALDVQSLAHDRSLIERVATTDPQIGVSGLEVWKMTMRIIKPGHPALVTAVISGISGLVQLEPLAKRQMEKAPRVAEAWNQALRRTYKYVQDDLLGRLDSFSPEQLVDLYHEPKGAQSLMSLLFSGDDGIHQAALGVFKVLSKDEDNRRGSIMHLVRAFFGTTLAAVAKAQYDIAKSGALAPCSIFMKLSRDVFSCLCDTQDGVLRFRESIDERDVQALQTYWKSTWATLDMIFKKTEVWSNIGHDKRAMQDFCRETMDFAGLAFDQYAIISRTLQLATVDQAQNATDIGKRLLDPPKQVFGSITKWLRLRDDYLVNSAVGLTSKMLFRLQEVDIQIDQNAAQYIENVVSLTIPKEQRVKTMLSMNHKAELQRALERHLGYSLRPDDEDEIVEVGTNGRQGTLSGWMSEGRSNVMPASTGSTRPPRGTIDVDAWASRSDADKKRRVQAAEANSELQKLLDSSTKGSEAFKRLQKQIKSTTPTILQADQKHRSEQQSFLVKRKQAQEEAKRKKEAELARQKLGAGSGIAGLGDMGKDHALKGQNVMVSSDESDEEDEELDDDLFGPSLKRDKKISRPDVDPRGAVGLRPEVKKGPTRIQRTVRSSKDMRARLAPDLQSLHKTMLKWDFFASGDYPPGAQAHTFREVANSYMDPITYRETFEPLLTLEAWQGMVKSREENTARPYDIKVVNRSNVDAFIEISTIVGHAENRELALREGDIILLSKSKKPSEDSDALHCLSRVYRVKYQKAHLEIIYQVMPNSSLASSLTSAAIVHAQKIQSILPLEREYGALQALQFYDLCQQIIKAAPSKRINYSEKQVGGAMDTWNVNRAQGEAICAALDNEGFSLIQGPPGSGKTKTIVAIVGGLLSNVLGNNSIGATKINVPRNATNAQVDSGTTKKLLVCAPSNAAVDEIVMRLKDGIITRGGRRQQLNIVRIGRSDAINSHVVDVTIDELVAKRMGGKGEDPAEKKRTADLFAEHSKVSNTLKDLYQRRDEGKTIRQELVTLESDIAATRKRKGDLGNRIDNVKDQERNAGREAELTKKRAQQSVLDEAHVICATLSGSGHDMFQSLNIEFETVVIDEAAQCVEMSSLIPLKYGCIKCILVGDPKQLPPTVFSKEAARFSYEQSLFVRMQKNFPDEVHLLDTQYRMHPDISLFPSRTFYDGLLKDGEGMAGLRKRPWHASALLAPYRFFDVQGQHQSAPKGHSLVNVAEIEVAMALYVRLTTDFIGDDYSGRIGIITPYKSQLRMLKDRFSQRFGNDIFDAIEFNTTDAFQGRESEIIIFSCVRASPAGGIGFLQDIRRMNVGLTRAKSSLWVLGNSESLSRGQFWRKLVEDARARDAYTSGDVMSMLKKPSSTVPASDHNVISMHDVGSHVEQVRSSDTGRLSEVKHDAQLRNAAPSTDINVTQNLRRSATPVIASVRDAEKMEGIRYRFKDRVSKDPRRTAALATGSGRPSLQPPEKVSEDVDMADADSVSSVRSGTATPSHQHHGATRPAHEGAMSRAETPLSAASGEDPAKFKRPSVAPGVPPKMAKKRPAASPFLPKKKK